MFYLYPFSASLTKSCAVCLLSLVLWHQGYSGRGLPPSLLIAPGRSPAEAMLWRWHQALVYVSLDRHDSQKDDPVWMDQSLTCMTNLFYFFSTAFILLSWCLPVEQSSHSHFIVLGYRKSLNWGFAHHRRHAQFSSSLQNVFISKSAMNYRIWSFFKCHINWNSHRQCHYWKVNRNFYFLIASQIP